MLLALNVVLHIVGIVMNLIGLQIADRVPADQFQVPLELEQFDIVAGVIGCFGLVIYIATVIVYLIWIYRAYKNLQLLGVRGLRSSPGWAVGWYFIPFLNLFKPCQIMIEIWKASNPNSLPEDGRAWQKGFASPLIGVWWLCWLAAGVSGYIAARAVFSMNFTLEDWRTSLKATMVSDALGIAAGISLCFLIHWIRQRQTLKLERIQADGYAEW